jgi:aspartyl-tRNA(Asn)/glutamyl-tRNA(Gln) amidotransferase subunit C
MEISQEQVKRVAKLARLDVSEDEKATFARQLSSILTHIDRLTEVATAGVEPTATVLPTDNVWRDDAVRSSLSQKQALANAPDQAEGFFCVPKILEDR